MKDIFDNVSYVCSKQITKQYSTSFSLAVKMLSPKIQNAIYAIYGFVRLADEIVDTFHDYDKVELLDELDKDLEDALQRKISLNPILNSFQEVVHVYNIDKELIDAFMASMRADLSKTEYNTVEDYEKYIYGSADVVGLMCLKVFVSGDKKQYDELKESAQKLGSAFQKVNFLRDLKDDLVDLNRSYFPQLKSGTELNEDSKNEIIAEINKDFKEAYIGIKKLPSEAKLGVYTAYIYYLQLLKKINRTHVSEIKNRRIRVSNPKKMVLLMKSVFNYKLNLI